MKFGLGFRPMLDAAAALNALLKASTWLPDAAIVLPQKFGETSTVPPGPATTVPAPPATAVPTAPGLVGHGNGLAAPPAHTNGVTEKIPWGILPGLSNSTLFQMEFS